jgi:hypothetical protein
MKKLMLCSLLITFMGCKSSKPGTSTPEEKIIQDYQQSLLGNAETVEGEDAREKVRSIVFRVIVEFFSIGEGTDLEAKKRFDSYLNQWHESGNPKVTYLAVPWGREGEVDFCFTLSGLTDGQQQQFISGLRSQLSSSGLVRISENQKCSHIR